MNDEWGKLLRLYALIAVASLVAVVGLVGGFTTGNVLLGGASSAVSWYVLVKIYLPAVKKAMEDKE